MSDIGLPEFVTPEDFIELHDIFKLHAELIMDCIDKKGSKHGARSSTTVHGAPDQVSDSVTAVKC
jgi:hypothetical protein